ncbi:NAD(P)H-dependent glycerol-3-phosphate dehydrogenase [Hazenella sp. IB182353]|uniref:NAD(P)H-dependent glycerol-3-phosphate dehydrogenase n=1 Tax=Polycladospora coralii TaxID=2771432 RepID=UPI0017463760|nr:NAD(P)H-dependent glycerol-3-phosphate dehydrogenase [Polycladospora coralii]
MKEKVAVVGAGSWGTALAQVLAENGHDVTLWARSVPVADELNQRHTNKKYLPQAKLHPAIYATTSLEEACYNKSFILFAVPSHAMRHTAREVKKVMNKETHIVHAAKGFEQDSWKRMSEVLSEELERDQASIAILSGPSHAEEVIQKSPTTVVVACGDQEVAKQVQYVLMNTSFRVYTHSDAIGVEVGGALKNIIALAAGLVQGLGFGDNAKAALMTRGLAEIARLGKAMGAKPITFVGLAGVGDLIVTCTSTHSRNWRAGYMLSQGKSLSVVLDEMGMVVEGVKTTRAAHALAKHYQVEMPLTEQLYQVLFMDKEPEQAAKDLMLRGKTNEMEEIMETW